MRPLGSDLSGAPVLEKLARSADTFDVPVTLKKPLWLDAPGSCVYRHIHSGVTMKQGILCSLLIFSAYNAFGQGTVIFNNRVSGTVVSHVWWGCPQIRGNWTNDFPAGTTSYNGFKLIGTVGGLSASSTFAQLLGAPGSNMPESSLVPGAGVTTFRTGGAAGNVAPTTATFSDIPADAPVATFQMVAWDNSSGLYPTWTAATTAWVAGLIGVGKSDIFVLTNIGGGTNPAPFLTNLTSFTLGYLDCPPHIADQPASRAAVVGGQAAFGIRAYTWTGYTNYQWYFNNSPLAGATNSTLLLSNLQLSNFGPYFAVVDEVLYAPSLATSSVANLTIAMSPSLTNFSVGSNAKFSFRTEAGPNYVVEYKSELMDPGWIQLSTNPGTGGVIDVSDSALGVASRFYRVRLY
jgi:hypothetical protein